MITTDDLKVDIGDYQYKILADDVDVKAQRSIDKAVTWLKTKYMGCQRDISEINYDDEVIKEVLIKRASYELYSMSEQEEKAKDKKDDAIELLYGMLGSCVYGSVNTNGSSDNVIETPQGVVINSSIDDWRGYK